MRFFFFFFFFCFFSRVVILAFSFINLVLPFSRFKFMLDLQEIVDRKKYSLHKECHFWSSRIFYIHHENMPI